MLPRIEIGSLSIPSLLFFWMIGIILCLVYYSLISRKFDMKWYIGLGFGISMIILEIFGAKLMFLLENPDNMDEFISWTSGYSLYGVFYFTPLFLIIVSLLFKLNYLEFMDFLAPGILLELGFYRFGCMCAGCCYGIEVGWGITNGSQEGLFPVQPIEAVIDLFIFALLVFLILKKKVKKGYAFLFTFLGYSLVRFILEFLRERNNILGAMSVSHLLALGMIVLSGTGLVLLYKKNRKKEKEESTL